MTPRQNLAEMLFSPPAPPSTGGAPVRNARAARRQMARNARRLAGRDPGTAHMPDAETLYGPLVKEGLARIERRRGRAPRVVFLDAPAA